MLLTSNTTHTRLMVLGFCILSNGVFFGCNNQNIKGMLDFWEHFGKFEVSDSDGMSLLWVWTKACPFLAHGEVNLCPLAFCLMTSSLDVSTHPNIKGELDFWGQFGELEISNNTEMSFVWVCYTSDRLSYVRNASGNVELCLLMWVLLFERKC